MCFLIGNETKATTLAPNWVSHNLSFPDLSVLLEVLKEGLVSQIVVKTTHKDFVTHAL